MKELDRLERRMHISGCIHLAILTLCAALPVALVFEDDKLYRLAWALGTVIPVQLIRFICERVQRKPLRWLLSFAVTAAAAAVAHRDYHWVYYVLTCVPMMISGLLLPRPLGRLIFTIPRIWWLFFVFWPYMLGKLTGIPLLCDLAILVSALMTVNFFLYTDGTRLLNDIRLSTKTEVSVTSLIRQNRKSMIVGVLLAVLVLAAVPFVLSRAVREEAPPVEAKYEYTPARPTPIPSPPPDKEYTKIPDGRLIDVDWAKDIWVWMVIAMPSVPFVVGLVYLFVTLLGSIDRRSKRSRPEVTDGLTFERLAAETASAGREHITGYEKKIRRRYEKLIKSRAPEKAPLSVMTPTELERAASVMGKGADTVHDIYRRIRYSPEQATRETYTEFKNAVRELDPPPARGGMTLPEEERIV
ncbi:MAG: hypothetical protein IKG85_06980 [Clostridia bacterium]|nr:hypothetical protein [Clostridia bacterium]